MHVNWYVAKNVTTTLCGVHDELSTINRLIKLIVNVRCTSKAICFVGLEGIQHALESNLKGNFLFKTFKNAGQKYKNVY